VDDDRDVAQDDIPLRMPVAVVDGLASRRAVLTTTTPGATAVGSPTSARWRDPTETVTLANPIRGARAASRDRSWAGSRPATARATLRASRLADRLAVI